MSFFPFLSTAELTHLYRERVKLLSKNRNNVLPEWARKDADNFFKRRKLIVCGTACPSEMRVLAKNADIIAFVDDFRVGERIYGIPIVNSDAWAKHIQRDPKIASCILTPDGRAYNYFLRQCMQWQIPFLTPLHLAHLFKTLKIDASNESGDLFVYGYEFFVHALENSEKLIKLSEFLEDDFSRFSWFSILMYRLTLNPFFLESCAVGQNTNSFGLNSYSTNRQFLKFSDQEVYVDGGAYNGDTIGYFVRAVHGKFKHIYAFEPIAAHTHMIRQHLANLQNHYLDSFIGKFSIIEKGMWDSETTLQFNPNRSIDNFETKVPILTFAAHFVDANMTSHIYDKKHETAASVQVPVTTIDKATNQDGTFLKFEIEGSELQALHGAVKTIERNHPQMAVSIYHKPEDLVTLTNFVINTGYKYRLGFRQHNNMTPDAMVLYCYH